MNLLPMKFFWISILFVASTVTFAQGASQYTSYQQAEYEEAKASRSVAALNRFIRKYPNSKLTRTAVYERDRLAYFASANSGSSDSVQKFIDTYPNSAWLPKAKYMLKQLRKGEKSKPAPKSLVSSSEDGSEQVASNNSMDRVRKALSVYETSNTERQKQQEEKEKQQVLLAKQQQKCVRLSDRLKTYEEGRNWYSLDAKGERRYLSEDEVQRNRQNVQRKYNQHCG